MYDIALTFEQLPIVWLCLVALLGLILGSVVGSFLGTAVVRWPHEKSVLIGRSCCDHCAKHLSPAELMPVLSFVWMRGGCRTCGGRIDLTHLTVEVSAALIGLCAFVLAPGVAGLLSALLGWWLLLLFWLDYRYFWLPDRLTLPLAAVGLAVALTGYGPGLGDRLIGAAGGFILLQLVISLYRWRRGHDGMGGGDPKLVAAIGAWIGWQTLPHVLLAAALLGLAGAFCTKSAGTKVDWTTRLPFGVLLAPPAWAAWLVISTV